MIKKNMLFLFLFCMIIFTNCSGQNSDDEQAIRQAALDYIEGWYTADAERMERALHPGLIKRFIQNPESNSILQELNKEKMVSMTKHGGGTKVPEDSYKIELKILDRQDNIASVLVKSEYIDYLHLAKFNNKWMIINVLWDYNR